MDMFIILKQEQGRYDCEPDRNIHGYYEQLCKVDTLEKTNKFLEGQNSQYKLEKK